MTKRIFWTAFIGSDNLGDEAIFNSLRHNLSLDTEKVTVTSMRPDLTAKETGLKAVYAKSPTALLRAIRGSDTVLMGGGGIIQDQSSLLNFVYYGYQLGLAKLLGKPVILCFVGVGPIKHRLSKLIFKMTASNISQAVVRDDISRRELLPYMKEDKILVVHDPVLNLPVSSSEAGPEEDYVLVSLRRWFFSMPMLPASIARKLNKAGIARKRYDQFVAEVATSLDEFLQHQPKLKLRFASFYDSEDVAVIEDVRATMKHSDRTTPPLSRLSEDEYVALVRGSKFVIGMRFHSLVLAAITSTPFVALTYSSKVDQFAESVGLGEYIEDVNTYDSSKAAVKFSRMYERRDKHTAELAEDIATFQRRNADAFQVINDLVK